MGASCAKKPASDGSSETAEEKGVAVTDNCGNPYYPFKKGLTIAYSVTPTSGAAGSADFTTRIVSVEGTKAKVQTELYGGAIADMEADCASGSVALTGSSGLGADLQGMTFKTTVLSSSGTSMPANVKANATWDFTETIKMEITGGATGFAGSAVNLTAREQSKAIGEESVTVPAGTFKAMKVETTRTTESSFVTATGASLGKIPTTTDTSTEWWVKGIGMVKTVTVNSDGTSTIEAKSVSGN